MQSNARFYNTGCFFRNKWRNLSAKIKLKFRFFEKNWNRKLSNSIFSLLSNFLLDFTTNENEWNIIFFVSRKLNENLKNFSIKFSIFSKKKQVTLHLFFLKCHLHAWLVYRLRDFACINLGFHSRRRRWPILDLGLSTWFNETLSH